MALVGVDGDAGAVVLAALRAIGDRLDEIEPAAVADEPDAVHRLRTTVRRLRSVLAVYGSLFDASEVDEVRRRYRKLGRRLGAVRDLEVRLLVAEAALQDAAESATFDTGALVRVTAGIVAETTASHHLAHQEFTEHQERPAAARRRAALGDLLAHAHAPTARPADTATRAVLDALLAREVRRAVVRASGVDATSAAVRLHAVRRAGRRLRYAAEALAEGAGDTFSARALRLAAAAERIQDVLGGHRDQSLFAEYLQGSAPVAAPSEQDRAVLERLAAAARRRAAERISDLDPAVHELRRAEREWLPL